MSNQVALIIFAKKLLPGQVKTRLQPQVSPEIALNIYRKFVEETLEKVKVIRDVTIWLGCFPDYNDPWLLSLSNSFRIQLFKQEGKDLGERMEHAFNMLTRKKYKRKVIIGTDSPHLPLHFIRSAFESLKKIPVVIGPSRDGGYYLLGISGQPPSVFRGISWSTDSVLKSTMLRLKEKQIPFKLLPEWYDIDRFEELNSLYAYWKGLKNNGGDVPDNLIHLLDEIESIRRANASSK
ncbi:MAG: TIGR04282 family arsenosugar biosynthesis glycosyltransferase, partial [Nitrospiria bacterium]